MSAIYEVNFKKYNTSFDKLLALEGDFLRTFHTCPVIMTRKKQLEKVVQKSKNTILKRHFKRAFHKRKKDFYERVIFDIFKEGEYIENRQLSDLENEACQLTKDILFIYSKKEEERQYLHDLLEHYAAVIDHEQECRESMVEEWRGCD